MSLHICQRCQNRKRPCNGKLETCFCTIDGKTLAEHAATRTCPESRFDPPAVPTLDSLPLVKPDGTVQESPFDLAAMTMRRAVCAACPRWKGEAGKLGVHCWCLGDRDCSNIVSLVHGRCPESRWYTEIPWEYDTHGYPTKPDGQNFRVKISGMAKQSPQELTFAELSCYFDRVVVINLKHRADKLAAFWKRFPADWPFVQPVVFEAIHGDKFPQPKGWRDGGGAWGCMLSHRAVLQQAIADGVKRLLVLEDDAEFADGFTAKIAAFLGSVPEWDQLMLGGQLFGHSQAIDLGNGVRRISHGERTHAYAVQGEGMRSLYQWWMSTSGHCDHRMGEWQDTGKRVYAPQPWIAYQAGGWSDIQGCEHQKRTWQDSRHFNHSGKYGDLIYGIAALRELGGGVLHMTPWDHTGMRMTPDAVAVIRPLLMAQPYIEGVEYADRKADGWTDLNAFRWNWTPAPATIYSHHMRAFRLDESYRPWLTVPDPKRIAPVIMNRSPRYHNDRFPWAQALAKYPDAVFVGLDDEYEAFTKTFGRIMWHKCRDFLELAQVIAGADLFVGNQSSPLAIAHAIGKPVIIEVCDGRDDNCRFWREGERTTHE